MCMSLSFYFNVNYFESSSYQLLYGVPHVTVLRPLRFFLYTTPLNTIISRSSVKHLLFADDSEHLFSFSVISAADSSFKVTHLEQITSKTSSWVSPDYVSLNPCKTQHHLSGHPQQLKQFNSPTIQSPLRYRFLTCLCYS